MTTHSTPRFLAVAVAVTAALLLPPALPAQQVGEPTTPVMRIVTATAIVRGRVLQSNGSPIRSAEVRLRSANGHDSRIATTDSNGQYEIRDLAPGEWTLKASKPGFVSQSGGPSSPTSEERPITIDNGQRLSFDIVLSRAGAIAGRVLDDGGEPLADVVVQAFKRRTSADRTQFTPAGVADRTDDTGAFRLYAIPPGTYYVRAVVGAGNRAPGFVSEEGAIYYPGTSNPENAETVAIAAGQDQLGITLVIPQSFAGVRIAGTIFTASGKPAGDDTSIHLMHPNSGRTAGSGMIARVTDGRFTIDNVPPGDYTLDAMGFPSRPDAWERGAVPISVGTSPIGDITIAMTPTRVVKGVLVSETGRLPIPIEVLLQTPDAALAGSNRITVPVPGDFSLPGIWGQHAISAAVPPGWMVKSIEIAGQELGSGLFDFSTVPASATLRIVVTSNVGEVSGTVTADREGRRALVIVFPDEETKWRAPSRYVAMTQSNDDGRYRISGLGEQRYLAVAVSRLEADEITDAAFLAEMKKSATTFSLREGEKKLLDLPFIQR